MNRNRRTFLQASSLAAAGLATACTTDRERAASQPTGQPQPRARATRDSVRDLVSNTSTLVTRIRGGYAYVFRYVNDRPHSLEFGPVTGPADCQGHEHDLLLRVRDSQVEIVDGRQHARPLPAGSPVVEWDLKDAVVTILPGGVEAPRLGFMTKPETADHGNGCAIFDEDWNHLQWIPDLGALTGKTLVADWQQRLAGRVVLEDGTLTVKPPLPTKGKAALWDFKSGTTVKFSQSLSDGLEHRLTIPGEVTFRLEKAGQVQEIALKVKAGESELPVQIGFEVKPGDKFKYKLNDPLDSYCALYSLVGAAKAEQITPVLRWCEAEPMLAETPSPYCPGGRFRL